MKAVISWKQARIFSLLLAASLGLLAGCKTSPKIDWNSRMGTYTYDQAVIELGPPDRVSPLSDGRTVADWIQHRNGGGLSFGVGTGFATGSTGVGVGAGTSTGYHDKVLRLTFDPDHRLAAWTKSP